MYNQNKTYMNIKHKKIDFCNFSATIPDRDKLLSNLNELHECSLDKLLS